MTILYRQGLALKSQPHDPLAPVQEAVLPDARFQLAQREPYSKSVNWIQDRTAAAIAAFFDACPELDP